MVVTAPNAVLPSALQWVEDLLLGSITTAVAILTIATLGFLMMSGRLPTRRAATVILGCFILFSASAIANGIIGSLGGDEPPPPVVIVEPTYTPATPKPISNDPYAGASVPDQRTTDILQ